MGLLDRAQELVLARRRRARCRRRATSRVRPTGSGRRAPSRPSPSPRRARSASARVGTSRAASPAIRSSAAGITSATTVRAVNSLVRGRDAGDAAVAVQDPRRRGRSVRTSPPSDCEVGDERVGQPLRAAARARPADGVAEQVQVEGGDRASRRRPAACRRASPRRSSQAREPPSSNSRLPRPTERARQQPREVQQPQRAGARRAACSGPPTGGKPESIVARTASKCSRNGSRELRPALAVARRGGVEARRGARRGRGRGRRPRRPGSGCAEHGRRVHPLQAVLGQRHAREHRRRGAGRDRRRRTCRGGSRAASAPRCAPRRRARRRPRGRAPSGRPRRAGSRRRARSGPAPMTIASVT